MEIARSDPGFCGYAPPSQSQSHVVIDTVSPAGGTLSCNPDDCGTDHADNKQHATEEVDKLRMRRAAMTVVRGEAETKRSQDDARRPVVSGYDGPLPRGSHETDARVNKLLSRRSHIGVNKQKSPTDATLAHHAATWTPDRPGSRDGHGTDGEAGHLKEKKKGVSFLNLSRFIPGTGTKKKEAPSEAAELQDDFDAEEDFRPEGNDAQLFSHDANVEGIEYHPRHPQPPPYIKFRAKFKKEKEFDCVFLAQELQAGSPKPRRRTTNNTNSPGLQGAPLQSDDNAVCAMEFSKDGKYLAAAGQDKIVRVWAVLSTPEERRQHEREEDNEPDDPRHLRLDAPVFQKLAVREYDGHEGPIIDLSWSKNNFLLSASADRTVRLWHTSRAECLCTFKHTEHVYTVQFHPRDDRFFLAGSQDMKLRLWSIPDKSVALWQQLNEVITAVAFTPDGKTAVAGTANGVCNFYETEGLKYQTQLHVRSAYGKNAKGSKICSIDMLNMSERDSDKNVKMLISSNDSRVRMYNFRDKSLEIKFKGHKSEERTIKSHFSDNGQYIMAGSEDKGAFIWSTGPTESEKSSQRPVETFEATSSQTTCAILAPTKARQLLAHSEDPIYDMCNPPPVTLLSRAESTASSRQHTDTGSHTGTPRTTDSPHKRATESPAYVARSQHPGGNIMVTASNTGAIRVYRQDCASSKRKSPGDSASIFGGKRPSSLGMARAMSKTSNGSRGRQDVNATQQPDDRIMSWRQGVSSTHSLDRKQSDAKSMISTRSVSPSKSGYSYRRSASIKRSTGTGGRRDSIEMTPANGQRPSVKVTSATPVKNTGNPSPPRQRRAMENGNGTTTLIAQRGREQRSTSRIDGASDPPSPDELNPLWLEGNHSYLAWNTKEYASQALNARATKNGMLAPNLEQRPSTQSVVSRLSSEEMSDNSSPAPTPGASENACRECAGTTFAMRNVRGRGSVPVCQRCGTLAA